MFGFWESVYLGLLVFGGGFLLIQTMLGHFGEATMGGHLDALDGGMEADAGSALELHAEADGHLEASAHGAGHGHHGGIAVSFITPLVIAPTLAGIGAVGLVLSLLLGWGAALHLPLALLGGLALGYAIFFILARVIAPMQGSSEVRVADLWGTVAEVTTPIPSNRLGEIRFIASGSYFTTPARSATGEPIPRGQLVMIEKLENSVALVRPTR